MRIEILRFATSKESTLGAMLIDSTFACFTIEDAWHAAKIPGETRIPEGMYDLKMRTEGGMSLNYSQRFPDIHKGMLWLQDVPGFEWVYLHVGNKASHSEGCILVGDTMTSNVTGEGFVGQSSQAYERIYPDIAAAVVADKVTVEIRAFG